ncbi:head-tail connector protein [Microbulbifer sp. JSM ZJ756]|uniref:head-tail connector protein n=1 Tax=Microbulbifer sp. JSM ZJ756 TaxID=3376191 RepID=UPI0037A5B128
MILDLALVKKHLIVEHGDDDVYLTSLCEAAEQQFNDYTGRVLYAEGADLSAAPENALEVTEAIQLGAAVLVAALYENREGLQALPTPTRMLWNPYRWLRV